jgi:hypothetical protein
MKQGDFLLYVSGGKIEVGKWVRTTYDGKVVLMPKRTLGKSKKIRKRGYCVSLNDLFQKYRGLL